MRAANQLAVPRIFDAHVHLEPGSVAYDGTALARNYIFNSVSSYLQRPKAELGPSDTVTLILSMDPDFDVVKRAAADGTIHALKIHSRIQKLADQDYPGLARRLEAMPEALPIVIDAFYYGHDLSFQPSLPAIIDLAVAFPRRQFVIAHCGGYRLLEYFFHLRDLPNVYFDLSFALQYLADSSLATDLKKLIRFTSKDRIMYGSDHPFASATAQTDILLEILSDLQITGDEADKIFYRNAVGVFSAPLKI